MNRKSWTCLTNLTLWTNLVNCEMPEGSKQGWRGLSRVGGESEWPIRTSSEDTDARLAGKFEFLPGKQGSVLFLLFLWLSRFKYQISQKF